MFLPKSSKLVFKVSFINIFHFIALFTHTLSRYACLGIPRHDVLSTGLGQFSNIVPFKFVLLYKQTNIWISNVKGGSPGLVVMGGDSVPKVVISNPGTLYCMDIFSHKYLL